MLDTRLTVIDEKGKEIAMEILFTFEANEKQFVLYFDPKDPEGETYASIFHEDGTLEPIEDGEDFEAVEEAFDNYMADEEEADQDEEDEE